jgi:hypothetical protein
MTSDVKFPEEIKEIDMEKMRKKFEKARTKKEREEQKEKFRTEIEKFYEDETA